MIDPEGKVHTRLYRKPQKKPLTLHYNSHHTTRTKIATVESMYNTATSVSSNRENEKYSTNIVDSLLLNNGYRYGKNTNKDQGEEEKMKEEEQSLT